MVRREVASYKKKKNKTKRYSLRWQ